jgi:hydrogenase-4 component B
MKRELPTAFDEQPSYRVTVEDPLWYWLYLPIERLVERVSKVIGLLQQGRIAVYLMYSFVTLIVVLLAVKR